MHAGRMFRTRQLVIGIVATIVVVATSAGCGSDEPKPEAKKPETSQNSSKSKPSESEPKPEPEPSDTPTPKLAAANGTNLNECQDANCEVEVRAGDELSFDNEPAIDVVRVKSVGDDELTLTLRGSTGGGMRVEGLGVSVSGGCNGNDCYDKGELTVTPNVQGKINDIEVRLAGTDDGRAVVLFAQR